MLAVQHHQPEPPLGAFRVALTTRERVKAARAKGAAALVEIMAERLLHHAARRTQATEADMIRDGFTVAECAMYGTRARTLAGTLTEAAADDARDTAAAEAAEAAAAPAPADPFAALDAELAALQRHLAGVETELARLRRDLGASGGQG